MKEKILKKARRKYGSVSKFCEYLGVSRSCFYRAINKDPHMKKLLARIKEAL